MELLVDNAQSTPPYYYASSSAAEGDGYVGNDFAANSTTHHCTESPSVIADRQPFGTYASGAATHSRYGSMFGHFPSFANNPTYFPYCGGLFSAASLGVASGSAFFQHVDSLIQTFNGIAALFDSAQLAAFASFRALRNFAHKLNNLRNFCLGEAAADGGGNRRENSHRLMLMFLASLIVPWAIYKCASSHEKAASFMQKFKNLGLGLFSRDSGAANQPSNKRQFAAVKATSQSPLLASEAKRNERFSYAQSAHLPLEKDEIVAVLQPLSTDYAICRKENGNVGVVPLQNLEMIK